MGGFGGAEHGEATGGDDVRDYRCACGQLYRLALLGARIHAWAENGRHSFVPQEVRDAACIRCGGVLPVVDGAA